MRKTSEGKMAADGLVFSGPGIGCNAAWQVGVVKALLSEQLAGLRGVADASAWRPDIFTGGVFGALNAAVLAQHADSNLADAVRQLERIWKEDIAGPPWGPNGVFRFRGNPLPFLTARSLRANPLRPMTALLRDAAFLSEGWAAHMAKALRTRDWLGEALDFINIGSFFDVEPYRRTLEKHVDLERLRRGPSELRVVATDWIEGQPTVFSQHQLDDDEGYSIFLASASITLIFQLVGVGGKPYAGGGDLMQTPLLPAISAVPEEADEVHLHVLRVRPKMKEIPYHKVHGSFELFNRNFALQLAYITDTEIRHAVADQRKPLTLHIYRPGQYQGGVTDVLSFERRRVAARIDEGYRDALGHDCQRDGCVVFDPAKAA